MGFCARMTEHLKVVLNSARDSEMLWQMVEEEVVCFAQAHWRGEGHCRGRHVQKSRVQICGPTNCCIRRAIPVYSFHSFGHRVRRTCYASPH